MALFGAAGSVVSRALVELDIDARGFDRKMDEADARLREHGNVAGKILRAGYVAAAGGAALLGAGLAASVKAASEAQTVRAREIAQLRALSISYSAHRDEIDKNIEATRRLSGFNDEQLLDSFTRLVAATHNVTGAEHDMAIAVDVARARHISLEAATQLVTKASIGQVGALRRMGINVTAVKDAQNKLTAEHIKASPALRQQAKDLDTVATAHKALALLQQRYAGQAKAYGDTNAGMYDRVRASVRALEVRVGSGLLPVLARFFDWLLKIIDRLSASKKAHDDLVAAVKRLHDIWADLVGVLRVAWGLLSDGVKYVGGVKRAVELLLTVMAVAKVASFFSTMVTGWQNAGRAAVTSAKISEGASREEAVVYAESMGAMEAATIGLSATIKSALISTGIGAVVVAAGIAVDLIITHWSKVKRFFEKLGGWLKDFFEGVWKWIETRALKAALAVVEPFSHLPGFMGGWARKAKKAMQDELWNVEGRDAARAGTVAGSQFGANLNASMAPFLTKAQTAASAAFAGAGGGLAGGGGASGAPGGAANSVRGGYSKGIASFAQANIVSSARSQIGMAYQWGGPAQLGKHTDCSGLAIASLRASGISVSGRTTWDLWKQGTQVSWSAMQAGDLVFFNIPEDGGTPPQHVGIYAGGGMMIHDPHTGSSVQQVSLDNSYWRSRFFGARRYVKTAARATSSPASGAPGAGAGGDNSAGASGVGAVAGSAAAFSSAAAAAPRSGAKTAASNKVAGIPSVDAVKRTLQKDYNDLALLHAAGLNGVIKKVAPEMSKIKAELSRPITNKELAAVRNQLANMGSTINAGLTKAKAIIAGRKSEFERAWSDFASKAMTAFDRVTAQHIAKMQSDTAKAIQQMSVTVTTASGSFLYGNGRLTPAQQALQDLQDQHDQQGRDQAVKDAQDALAAATDPAGKQQAQQQLDAALYDQKVAALQKQADLEQKAADDALQAAQDAAQATADQQAQDYQDQRDAQRDALANQLADLEAHLEARKASFADADSILAGIVGQDGATIGNAFVQGLRDSLAAAGIDLSTYLGATGGGRPLPGNTAYGMLNPGTTTPAVHITQVFPDDRPAEPAARAAKAAAGRVWAT